MGIRPSLSVDVETSVPNDFFTQMRTVFSLQKNEVWARRLGGEKDTGKFLTSREVLELRFPGGTDSLPTNALESIGDRYERLAERVIVGCENGEAAHARALDNGLDPESWLVRRSSLEDVFLRLTGRSLDE